MKIFFSTTLACALFSIFCISSAQATIHLACKGSGKVKEVNLTYEFEDLKRSSFLVGDAFGSRDYKSTLEIESETSRKTLHLVTMVGEQYLTFVENLPDAVNRASQIANAANVLITFAAGNQTPTELYLTYEGDWYPFSDCHEDSVSTFIAPEQFDDYIRNSSGTVLLKFTAVWCGACKIIEPVLVEYAKTHSDTKIIEIDETKGETGLAKRFRVNKLPTVFIYEGGRLLGELKTIVQKDFLKRGSQIESQIRALRARQTKSQ